MREFGINALGCADKIMRTTRVVSNHAKGNIVIHRHSSDPNKRLYVDHACPCLTRALERRKELPPIDACNPRIFYQFPLFARLSLSHYATIGARPQFHIAV